MEGTEYTDTFDENAYNRSLGLAPDTDEVDTISLVSDTDKQALSQLAAQSPEGVKVAPSGASGAVPDYLKDFLSDERPTITPPDYPALFEQQYGIQPEGEMDADTFAAQAAYQDTYSQGLDTDEYRQLFDWTTREYDSPDTRQADDVTLIGESVAQEIKSLYKNLTPQQAELQEEKLIRAYVVEGELTGEGMRKAAQLRAELADRRAAIEETVRQQAGAYSEQVKTSRSDFRAFMAAYQPDGIPLAPEDTQLITDFVLGGELDKLMRQPTHELIARITIQAIPQLRSKTVLGHYTNGKAEGAKLRIAGGLR